jgi:hypothetical protein
MTLALLPTLLAAFVASLPAAADAPAADCLSLPRPTMHVRLVLESGVAPDLRGVVERTVATVWRGEGIAVEWLPPSPPGPADPKTSMWLRLTLAPIGDLRTQHEPTLGVVRVAGGAPRPDIVVSVGAVREWIRRERDRRFRTLFMGMSRLSSLDFGGFDVLADRAVGYAAAHEVGHFVLASTTHDPRGLMRRDLVARTVARVEHRDLRLSDASHERLQQRLALAAACP